MSSFAVADMQADWENREFLQNAQYNLMKVTAFLNQFDIATRIRLAKIDEKLMVLERKVEFLEGAVKPLGKK